MRLFAYFGVVVVHHSRWILKMGFYSIRSQILHIMSVSTWTLLLSILPLFANLYICATLLMMIMSGAGAGAQPHRVIVFISGLGFFCLCSFSLHFTSHSNR